jgi:spoIIIJ-associated protein
MYRSYEFQGKSVDHALEKASNELNIPTEKIKHEVLAYGSSGIFGLVGIKKAKIKVFVEENKSKKQKANILEARATTTPITKTAAIEEPITITDHPKIEATDIVNYGKQSLTKIITQISPDATVSLTQEGDTILFNIAGGDSGMLIGKRGQTLEAIQYLLEKMINKKSEERLRVAVDVEGYLEKRKLNLQQMASRMAEKAKRINKPVTIGQMNPHDRRIVHIHLKNESGIRTQSLGGGYYRKLMIFPKKQNEAPENNTDSNQ